MVASVPLLVCLVLRQDQLDVRVRPTMAQTYKGSWSTCTSCTAKSISPSKVGATIAATAAATAAAVVWSSQWHGEPGARPVSTAASDMSTYLVGGHDNCPTPYAVHCWIYRHLASYPWHNIVAVMPAACALLAKGDPQVTRIPCPIHSPDGIPFS